MKEFVEGKDEAEQLAHWSAERSLPVFGAAAVCKGMASILKKEGGGKRQKPQRVSKKKKNEDDNVPEPC